MFIILTNFFLFLHSDLSLTTNHLPRSSAKVAIETLIHSQHALHG
jgi:hypothetical protein